MIRQQLRQTRTPGAVIEDLDTTAGDYLGAVGEEALFMNPGAILWRLGERAQAEAYGGNLVDPEEATAQYEHLGLGFDRPHPRAVIDKIVDRKRRELVRRSVIERADAGPGLMAAGFAKSLLASIIDPINIAAIFIPGGGEALLGKLGLAFKSGSTLAKASVGRRVFTGAVEGAVGAAAIEPLILYGASLDQTDYELADSLLNLALSSVIGGGVHGLIGVAAARRARLEAADVNTRRTAFKAALAQFAEGRSVDVNPIFDLDIRYRNAAGKVAESELDHVGVPIETLSPQAALVLAAKNTLAGIPTGETVTLQDLRRLNFSDEQVKGVIEKRADALRADIGDRARTAAQIEAVEKGLPISLLTPDQTFKARARGISRGVTVDTHVPLDLARDVGADTAALTDRYATERFGLPTADEIVAASKGGAGLQDEVTASAAIISHRTGLPSAGVRNAAMHYAQEGRSSLHDKTAAPRVAEAASAANSIDGKEKLAALYQEELADFQSRLARLGIDPEAAQTIVNSFDPEGAVDPDVLARAHEAAAHCIARA